MVRVVQLVFREELPRVLQDLFKLFEAVTGPDAVHNSGLHGFYPDAEITEELLDQEGGTLSDQVGVDTVDLVYAALVLLVCCVKLRAQLFSHQSNELYLLKFFLENSCVTHQLSVVVADNRLSSSGVKFRTGFSLLLKLKLPV